MKKVFQRIKEIAGLGRGGAINISDGRVPCSDSMELNMTMGYREGSWY